MRRLRLPIGIRLIALVACLTGGSLPQVPKSQSQISVLMSGGFWAAFQEIQPEFEKRTGIKITLRRGPSQGEGPNTIGAQLRAGVPADVVIMSRDGLNDLIAEGKTVAGSDVNLAQTPLALSVRAGAPKPDISTVKAFKRTMLQTKSVTCESSPAIYLLKKLFPQLGIANEMKGKVNSAGVAAVAKGDVEIAIQPLSELVHIPGTDLVGTLPSEIQYIAVFSAAIVKDSTSPKEAKELIRFLRSEKARAAVQRNGMAAY